MIAKLSSLVAGCRLAGSIFVLLGLAFSCILIAGPAYAEDLESRELQGGIVSELSTESEIKDLSNAADVQNSKDSTANSLNKLGNEESANDFEQLADSSNNNSVRNESDAGLEPFDGKAGLQETEKGLCYVNEDGSLTYDAWKTVNGNNYYFGTDGYAVKGIQLIDKNTYCFDNDSCVQLFGWQYVNGAYYYFKSDTGIMMTGLQKIYGKYYYLDYETGIRYTGWLNLDDEIYYFRPDSGERVLGWVAIEGNYYYFKSDTAAMMTGLQKIYGKYYYLNPETGIRYSGWLDMDGSRYYFKSDTGARLTGWQKIYGNYYYFKSDTAAMMTGLQKIYGKYYYLNPETGIRYSGWLDMDGSRYYFKSDTGARLTGWQKIYGNYYHFGLDGRMSTGSERIYGITYYFDEKGRCANYYPVRDDMSRKAQKYSSGTGYLIMVNLFSHRVAVFKGWTNNWSLQYYWSCVTGAPGTPTITGSFYTTGFKRPSLSTDSRAIYCTQIWGGYFFHSILASENELGKSLSHGCIRLPYSAAHWIQSNINSGTRVIIY